MNLLETVLQEYFYIVHHLRFNLGLQGDKCIIDNRLFYQMLDKNPYLNRNDKLTIYKKLNMIVCNNSKGFTSVVYDKSMQKSTRKIVINMDTYNTLRYLYENKIN